MTLENFLFWCIIFDLWFLTCNSAFSFVHVFNKIKRKRKFLVLCMVCLCTWCSNDMNIIITNLSHFTPNLLLNKLWSFLFVNSGALGFWYYHISWWCPNESFFFKYISWPKKLNRIPSWVFGEDVRLFSSWLMECQRRYSILTFGKPQ